MDLLYSLQSVRGGFAEKLFAALTYLGSEYAVIACVAVVLWLFGRRLALRLAMCYAISGFVNHMIKIIAAVPRPWELDDRILPSQAALADATGYSLPSGHTQTITSVFTTLSYSFRKKALFALTAVIIPVIMFSRMYLGVHTLTDVLTGFAVSLTVTLLMNKLLDRVETSPNYYRNVFLFCVAMALVLLSVSAFKLFTGTEPDRLVNMITVTGGVIGFTGGCYVDSRNDDVKLPHVKAAVMVVLGIAAVLLLRSCLKLVLGYLPGSLWQRFVTYAVTTFYISGVHPMLMRRVAGEQYAK